MEKPTMKQRIDALGTFVWDSEHGTVLGRGGRSWAEIGLFYLVYYACLASFFAATLAVFYETVSDTEPKLQSDSSLLNGNPGLAFRPRVDLDDPKVKATSEMGENESYRKNLDSFLKRYVDSTDTADCIADGSTRTGEKEACQFDVSSILKNNCPSDKDYGFADGEPCVIIKLNKVFGWVPKMWSDIGESPIKPEWNMTYDPAVVPVRCYAKESHEKDKLGELSYYPQQGFPIHYFPYENQKDYQAPLVFVKFGNTVKDDTIEVECRAYAKNIEYEPSENSGNIRFKLLIK